MAKKYKLKTTNCRNKMAAIKLLSNYVKAEVYGGVMSTMTPAKKAFETGVIEVRVGPFDFLDLKRELKKVYVEIIEYGGKDEKSSTLSI